MSPRAQSESWPWCASALASFERFRCASAGRGADSGQRRGRSQTAAGEQSLQARFGLGPGENWHWQHCQCHCHCNCRGIGKRSRWRRERAPTGRRLPTEMQARSRRCSRATGAASPPPEQCSPTPLCTRCLYRSCRLRPLRQCPTHLRAKPANLCSREERAQCPKASRDRTVRCSGGDLLLSHCTIPQVNAPTGT